MDYAIIIPARWLKRLPGKPLILIKEYQCWCVHTISVKKLEDINTYVATDSIKIKYVRKI